MRRLRVLAFVVPFGVIAAPPAQAQSQPYYGQLMLTAASYCPVGWLEANGQILPIPSYDVLFSLLGTTYGGDGETVFALPDLRGRAPIHLGQGPGLTNRTLGEQAGTETVTLVQSQMPAHTHALLGTTAAADAASPTAATLATKQRTTVYRAAAVPNTTLYPGSIGAAGGSQAHDNMPPVLVMRWCIANTGVYPAWPLAPPEGGAPRTRRLQPRRSAR